ncbi:putative transcription factor bHLH family [Helianthus annuus]|nr:putative transcription factor bHLH family [Helianthus annuus]
MMVLMKMLRPLVENNAWDYCIVWKFGDDPSRCIEWMGCCCSGSQGVCRNVKEEMELLHVPYLCRDVIHGEVAVSKQPMWLSNDSIGTQIVVPVEGGLIELYRSKHIPEDRMMIENLISRLGVIVDHGLHVDESKNCLSSYLYHHHTGPTSELLFAVQQPTTHSLIQGKWVGYVTSDWAMDFSGDDKAFEKTKNKKVRGSKYKSKNLDAERNRRQRIKDGLYTLRALVPKISKMDHASIVGDAVDYIIDLQKNIKDLQDELKELEEQDSEVNDDEVEVEVEVHEIGAREFLLKLMCSYKPGQFLRIMETVDSLGLEVIDINITTCNASVLNVLNLKAKDKDVAAKSLRDSLLTVCSIKAM